MSISVFAHSHVIEGLRKFKTRYDARLFIPGVSMSELERVEVAGLRVDKALFQAVRDEFAPQTGIGNDTVWATLAEIVRDFGPKLTSLLQKRDRLQAEIDNWLKLRDTPPMPSEWREFLMRIGYLDEHPGEFHISTGHVHEEIAQLAGPQLVVPVDNARYALNAANARWGSLYDALYGTDLIAEAPGYERGNSYNPKRGELVIAEGRRILDQHFPLAQGSHADVTRYSVDRTGPLAKMIAELEDGTITALAKGDQFVGFLEYDDGLQSILLKKNRLHVDMNFDETTAAGAADKAQLSDILVESALTTIMDCEDSVASVNAEDKLRVYRNWLGLMRGDLVETFVKGGDTITRRLLSDRNYLAPDGCEFQLSGLSRMLVRHVGAHITTDAVLDSSGAEIAETFLDAVITVLAAVHKMRRDGDEGSVYIVKPKQHGAEEVRLAASVFGLIEERYCLPKNCLKIGIMDEERRTTLNLAACIHAARERLIFINTGFLDRTGDEIHTSMQAGPMLPKPEIKSARWMLGYEDWNVDVGLAAGMSGRAQIGKGMWAMPDEMRAMMETKVAHPLSAASCAWVPSPTAATLHALHYLEVDVAARQAELASRAKVDLDELLYPPLLGDRTLTSDEIQRELDNNAQGILGYVVRWVEQGVGCSKVPDIDNVGLMEDRATLRISSQHIANWLHHGLVNDQQVVETMQRMAEVVDRQNQGDEGYRNMAPDFESSIAFQAALELVFEGRKQPNGYTEHILIRRRREFLAREALAVR